MNKKTQTFATALVVTLLLSVGLLLGFSTANGQDNDEGRNGNRIVGAWTATVTMRNCQTNEPLRSFPVLNTFNQGGTMSETSRSLINRSPAHGIWERTNGNRYKSVFVFLRSNPDGTDNGYQKVKRQHTLNGDTLTTVATFENFNPQGERISTGCATEIATRLSE